MKRLIVGASLLSLVLALLAPAAQACGDGSNRGSSISVSNGGGGGGQENHKGGKHKKKKHKKHKKNGQRGTRGGNSI